MNQSSVLIIFSAVFCYAQQPSIPAPVMIPKAKHISFTQAINDYDGDGAKDLIVVWHDPVNPRKRYLNVYSINKKEYLLVTKEPVEANQVTADDFDNDDLTELVVGSKIFEYSEPVIKKITE